jgi:hypothetical protein
MSQNKNSTRFNIHRDPADPKPHLDSGYEQTPSDDLTIPSCGITDADEGMFNLFNREIPFTVSKVRTSNGPVDVKKPSVIFATGERFATAKQLKPLKDKDGRVILPAISIRRRSIEQSADDINGRGINQQTGTLTIATKLADKDRDFQNYLNKFALENMDLPETSRETGANQYDQDVIQGGLLQPKLKSSGNIYDIYTIPQPQFFTATYEVVFWTSFTEHMTYLIETFMSSYLPQDKMFRINTDKGYWFMAYVDDQMASGDNFDDFKDNRRVLRYTISMKVKGYILAGDAPGQPVAVRKWTSAPDIVFDFHNMENDVHKTENLEREPIALGMEEKFILSDLEENPKTKQKDTTERKYLVKKEFVDKRTGRRFFRYVPVLQRFNLKGESVFYTNDFDLIQQIVLKNK